MSVHNPDSSHTPSAGRATEQDVCEEPEISFCLLVPASDDNDVQQFQYVSNNLGLVTPPGL